MAFWNAFKKTNKKQPDVKPLTPDTTVTKSQVQPTTTKDAKLNSQILIKNLATEKVTMLNKNNCYMFEIALKANKIEVKKEIKKLYGVTPTAVNIIHMLGKKVYRGRKSSKRSDWKKAYVTLKTGEVLKQL